MNRIVRAPWRSRASNLLAHRPPRRYQSGPSPQKDEPIDIPSPQSWYQRLGPVTHFFGWFHRTQGKRPLTVQLCTSTFIYLCGDLLAQDIGGEQYDGQRTLRMITIGAVASIPGYKWCDNHIPEARRILIGTGSYFWAIISTMRQSGCRLL